MAKKSLAIHGGAGTIPRGSLTAQQEREYHEALGYAVECGWKALHRGASSLEAVLQSVIALEDCPLFNAGRGSVINNKGEIECDASIMEGKDLAAGAVAAVQGVRNPILLARHVLADPDVVFLTGEGAQAYADQHKLAREPFSYFFTEARHEQLLKAQAAGRVTLDHTEFELPTSKPTKYGTVGAVACDEHGHLAAATSTGGLTNKKYGRIGDSSIIGAGTYANNQSCAVSCTGIGEWFIRGVVGYSISSQMLYGHKSLKEASSAMVQDWLAPRGGEGGLISVDHDGNICLEFNSEGMYRGWVSEGETIQTAIYR